MPTTSQLPRWGGEKGLAVVPPIDSRQRHAGWLTWRQTAVDGRPAFYGEAGNGPPVLFLHGWGLDHKAYKRALSRLVTAGLRVLAPALPGFRGHRLIEPRSDQHVGVRRLERRVPGRGGC